MAFNVRAFWQRLSVFIAIRVLYILLNINVHVSAHYRINDKNLI